MFIKGFLTMVIFLQIAVSEDNKGVVNELACEGEVMYLKCPKGHTIEILAAMYGKRNYKYCYMRGPQVASEKCAAPQTLTISKRICEHRQRCRLLAGNDLYGSPCDTRKYLEVSYRCLKNSSIKSLQACEHDKLTFGCPEGKRIKLVNALYGRKNGLICTKENSEHTSLKCDSIKSLEILATKCDYRKECSLTVNNEFFGDPCIPHTDKYLQLDYLCITTKKLMSNTSCESEDTMILKCPEGSISIKTAFWGKRDPKICAMVNDTTSNCEASGTLDTVKSICDLKYECVINLSDSVFSDHCPGVFKYLEVDYVCEFVPIQLARTCEHDKMKLHCPSSQFIWISGAYFGRRSQYDCYEANKPVVNNICDAKNTFDIVESRCQNKAECMLDASVQVFGDPCCYSYKFLEVNYMCKKEPRLLVE